MQDFREITSALCDTHTILTYLVGVEMIQPTGLSDQAERLEAMAVQAVTGLANVALSVDKTTESQERMGRLRERVKPGCDELAQTLVKLLIEQKAVEVEAAMDLVRCLTRQEGSRLGRGHAERREIVIIRRSRTFNATSCMLG